MYGDKTKDAILQDLLELVDPTLDTRQGSLLYDVHSIAAVGLTEAYIQLGLLLDKGFADTTFGEYLDRRAAELGLTRKPSVKATGQLTFTGVDGTVIPVGTEVSTADSVSPVVFVTKANGTITGGTVTVAAEAKEGGVKGNAVANAITLIIGNNAGIANVVNNAPFSGGVDTETDAELLDRYYKRVQAPATSGNANHYVTWAKEISGIADAKVYPIWNGNGTVKVVLLDTEMTAPDNAKITEVANHIAANRPVGATVTVVGATEVPINVTATVTLASGHVLGTVVTEIQNGIVKYLKTLAFKDPIVRYTQIGNVILDTPGVLDYSGLTVNGGTANLSISDGSVAVIGMVNIT